VKALDGLVDAGVVVDDDSKHVVGPDMRIGDPHPGGRLVLIIVELPSEGLPND
jgi:crossover junction endodeoxyribonuclease RusA